MVSHQGTSTEITSICQQVCGGGECGTGRVCLHGIDSRTEMPLSDQYAASVLTGREADISQFEINGVREFRDGEEVFCCEDNHEPEYFSVYVRFKSIDGFAEVQCVGDFGIHSDASRYAEQLGKTYQCEVVDRYLVSNTELV